MAVQSDLTMQELLMEFPGAQRALFRHYHIGGCQSCGFRPDETLAQVCERNGGLDPEQVLENVRLAWEEDKKLLVEPSEAAKILAAGEADFIDIRTQEEFDAVHIPGSRKFTQEMMQEVLGTAATGRQVILIDHQGSKALDATTYFAGHGLTTVKGLRGGIDAWSLEVDSTLPRYTLE